MLSKFAQFKNAESPDTYHIVWNRYTLKATTSGKGSISNLCHTSWYDNVLKVAAVIT